MAVIVTKSGGTWCVVADSWVKMCSSKQEAEAVKTSAIFGLTRAGRSDMRDATVIDDFAEDTIEDSQPPFFERDTEDGFGGKRSQKTWVSDPPLTEA